MSLNIEHYWRTAGIISSKARYQKKCFELENRKMRWPLVRKSSIAKTDLLTVDNFAANKSEN